MDIKNKDSKEEKQEKHENREKRNKFFANQMWKDKNGERKVEMERQPGMTGRKREGTLKKR